MKRLLLLGLLAFPGTGSPLAAIAAPFDPANARYRGTALRARFAPHHLRAAAPLLSWSHRALRQAGPPDQCLDHAQSPRAGAGARMRTLTRRPREPCGLLYGIPFIAKDNYDTAGIATSGGSAALKHSVPSANAFVAAAAPRSRRHSPRQGQHVRARRLLWPFRLQLRRGPDLNPYNTARDASGSSSGSAAAVAADFAAFALGTDTSGSIRGPGGRRRVSSDCGRRSVSPAAAASFRCP